MCPALPLCVRHSARCFTAGIPHNSLNIPGELGVTTRISHGPRVSIIKYLQKENHFFLQYSMELYLTRSSLMVGVVYTVSCQPSTHSLLWQKEREKGRKGKEKKGKLLQPLWRTVWRFLKKLKIEFSCDPVIWRKLEFKKIHEPNVHGNTIYNSQDMETT